MVVVVLGNRLHGPEVHDTLQDRMDVGIDVLESTSSEYLLVSGAQTNPEVPHAECEVMAEYAISQGVDDDRVLLDDAARDTIGNGYFSRLLVDELPNVDTVYPVSSCYHMDRVEFVFERCFGPTFEINAEYCSETDISADQLDKRTSLKRTREFFEPVAPGDVDEIRARLVEAHDYYDWFGES